VILAIFFLVVHLMYPAKPGLPAASASINAAPASAGELAISVETPAAGGENQRTSSEA
jgi:hypothetical protein